ncbi:MAG: hypothetical protein AAFX93_18555 [Verrucomicrobiota bacterium]
MIEWYYSQRHRQRNFIQEAESWLDTKFRTNAKAKGKFVDCHNLQASIHIACGALGSDFPVPRGMSQVAAQRQIATMYRFLKNRPEFEEVQDGEYEVGDLLTGKAGNGEYHMAGYLGEYGEQEDCIITCISGPGVVIRNLRDPSWSNKLIGHWRIIEEWARHE